MKIIVRTKEITTVCHCELASLFDVMGLKIVLKASNNETKRNNKKMDLQPIPEVSYYQFKNHSLIYIYILNKIQFRCLKLFKIIDFSREFSERIIITSKKYVEKIRKISITL